MGDLFGLEQSLFGDNEEARSVMGGVNIPQRLKHLFTSQEVGVLTFLNW